MNLFIDKRFSKSVPREKLEQCTNLFSELRKAIEEGTVHDFYNRHDAKDLKGTDLIRKFRLNDADRILYVKAEDVPRLRNQYSNDSILILEYSTHDKQGTRGRGIDINSVGKSFDASFVFSEEINTDAELMEKAKRYLDAVPLHIVAPLQLEKYLNRTDDCYDVVLSDEQRSILEDIRWPLILYGCAGSGKTILCTHLIYLQAENNSSVLYVSVSEKLNDQVRKRFRSIAAVNGKTGDSIPRIQIQTLFVLMRGELDWEKEAFIDAVAFSDQFCNSLYGKAKDAFIKCQKEGLDAIAIWAEIRGILKGSLDANWCCAVPIKFNASDFSDLSFFCDHKLLKYDDRKKEYTLVYGTEYNCIKARTQDLLKTETNIAEPKKQQILNTASKLDAHFFSFSKDYTHLSKEDYFALKKECSRYDRSIREQIFTILEQYQIWLKENQYYDDNDLARAYAHLDGRQTFEFICIDEVQDLTEMQLWTLFSSCRDSRNMVYAGDVHQLINPTHFSEERIRKLYYLQFGKSTIKPVSLKMNYRSQKEIVRLGNALSKLRKDRIGSFDKASEIPEDCDIEGWKPMRLNANKENLRSMIRAINALPNAAAIAQKPKDIEQFKACLGDDPYNGNFYTIQEIKGLEKQYIFTYNMASCYADAWKVIFDQSRSIKGESRYRHCFNTFYVAITRAQSHLCIYEDDLCKEMETWLIRYMDEPFDFSKEALFLNTEASGEDWYNSARQLEANRDYERAVLQYRNSQFEDYEECIVRCDILHLLLDLNDEKTAVSRWCEHVLINRDTALLPLLYETTDGNGWRCERICADLFHLLREGVPPKDFTEFMESLRCYIDSETIVQSIIDCILDSTYKSIKDTVEYAKAQIEEA